MGITLLTSRLIDIRFRMWQRVKEKLDGYKYDENDVHVFP